MLFGVISPFTLLPTLKKTFLPPTVCPMGKYTWTLIWKKSLLQKQPSRRVLRKRCSKNTQQIYRRTPMPNCDFNKVASNFIEIALRHGCSPVNLLHIFRTTFPKNTSGRLLLLLICFESCQVYPIPTGRVERVRWTLC